MSKKWEFFNSSTTEVKNEKIESKKTPGKFLSWVSSLLKKKKEEPFSLNLSESESTRENLKQEIASIPEEDRAETESFLAEEIKKIEKKREGQHLELRDEAETESPAESFENKFKLGEKVSFLGESGWRVESIAGNQVEIGKIRKDFRGRDVYERKIVKDNEIIGVAQHENLAFKIGESVSLNGEPGWEVVSLSGEDGKYLEVGKIRADKKGTLIFERKIVGVKEVERKT